MSRNEVELHLNLTELQNPSIALGREKESKQGVVLQEWQEWEVFGCLMGLVRPMGQPLGPLDFGATLKIKG